MGIIRLWKTSVNRGKLPVESNEITEKRKKVRRRYTFLT